MIRILIWGLILYIAYVLYKLLLENKIIRRRTAKKNVSNEDDAFSDLDIRDAEYEDLEEES